MTSACQAQGPERPWQIALRRPVGCDVSSAGHAGRWRAARGPGTLVIGWEAVSHSDKLASPGDL